MLTGAFAAVLAGWSVVTALAAEPAAGVQAGAGIRKFSFPLSAELTRADLYTLQTVPDPQAVLVLCPGFNENGEGLVRQPAWQEFARAHRLALCAISFASPVEELQSWRGYYRAARGSGDVLLNGLRRSFGRDLPILAYGFSGGAHFTASLVNWRPARVLSWCAYSAAWWEEPQARPAATPVGLVACGDEDADHYGASLTFFSKGRALGRPWTWVSLGGTGHAWSGPLDGFVRAYFAAVLKGAKEEPRRAAAVGASSDITGGWRDVDTKAELSASQAAAQPTLACWLPAKSLVPLWNDLHRP